MLKARLQPRVRAAPLPPSRPRPRAPRSPRTPRHLLREPGEPASLCGLLAGRREEKRGGRLSPCPPSACSSQPGSPELRLEHRRHLPALLPARGRGCPAKAAGAPPVRPGPAGRGPLRPPHPRPCVTGVAAPGGPSPGLRPWRYRSRYRRPPAHAGGWLHRQCS